MRAERATDYIGLRHFRHHGLDVPDWYRSNHPSAFVADDVGLIALDEHEEASAAVDSERLVRYDRQPVVDVVGGIRIAPHDQVFSTERLRRFAQGLLQSGFQSRISVRAAARAMRQTFSFAIGTVRLPYRATL